jgi:hypothetical protein
MIKNYFVIYNPLKDLTQRGISIYSKEITWLLNKAGIKTIVISLPVFFKLLPRPLILISSLFMQQLILPLVVLYLRFFRKSNCTIIDAYNSYSIIGAFLTNYIYIIHDFIPFDNPRWFLKLEALYQRILFDCSPFIKKLRLFYISENVKNIGDNLIIKHSEILPNIVIPLDCREFLKKEETELVDLFIKDASDEIILATVSGVSKNKDFETLLLYLSNLGIPIRLIAMGFSEKFNRTYNENLCILSPGIVEPKTIAYAINKSNFFIFHSIKEGFGRPVVEALQCNSKVMVPFGIPAVDSLTSEALKNCFFYKYEQDSFKKSFYKCLNSKKYKMNSVLSYSEDDILAQLISNSLCNKLPNENTSNL